MNYVVEAFAPLIKVYVQISCIQLSFGIVPLQEETFCYFLVYS
jgi:hypothetical protein